MYGDSTFDANSAGPGDIDVPSNNVVNYHRLLLHSSRFMCDGQGCVGQLLG